MTHGFHDDAWGPPAPQAEAYVALLRREQQIDALQASFGWRLLSRYGPYKRRYVLPAWRALRRALDGLRGRRGADALQPYDRWAAFVARLRAANGVEAGAESQPRLVSVVMTVDASSVESSERAIASLLRQEHCEWELSVARVGKCGVGPRNADPRIRTDPNLYDSEAAALTSVLAGVRGAIVARLPTGVTLAPDALSAVVSAFDETGFDVAYTDEDLRDLSGRCRGARFLPGWSPDLLLSSMYWSRVAYFRSELVARLLPLAPTIDGAHGYDLALRATEQRVAVVHVPRVLAHVHSSPDAAMVEAAGARRALEAAVVRRGSGARVTEIGSGVFRVRYPIVARAKISVVIPTRDGFHMLRRCLAALARTDHPDFEVLIVDNGSCDEATLALMASSGHRVLRRPGPFNFSRLNNEAVRETSGRYVLFLNDDTEPTDPGWLDALEEHAQRPEVGAVGAKLLYADGRIQHAGIALGIGGIAGHPGRFARQLPEVVRDVSAVTAACLMMRREVFDDVGGFDEALPVNSNDVDLCLRLRSRGLLVVYTPHAVVRHYESQTRGARATADDHWLMSRRWRDALLDDPYYSPNLDRREEGATPDLEKPDGWICSYGGVPCADGVLDLGAGEFVEQRFFTSADQLVGIMVTATVAGPSPDVAMRLVVRRDSEGAGTLRSVARSVVGLRDDERWFRFDPIPATRDRFLCFRLEVAAGHAVTLRRHPAASDVMGPCSENGRPSFGTLQFRLFARAPYRCASS